MLASKSTFALLALLAPLGLQVASVAVDTRPIVTVTSIIPGGKGPMYAIEQGHKFAVFKAAGIMQAIEMKYAVNEGDDPEKQFTLIEWTDTEVRKVDAAPASNATFRVSTELEGPKSNPRVSSARCANLVFMLAGDNC